MPKRTAGQYDLFPPPRGEEDGPPPSDEDAPPPAIEQPRFHNRSDEQTAIEMLYGPDAKYVSPEEAAARRASEEAAARRLFAEFRQKHGRSTPGPLFGASEQQRERDRRRRAQRR